MKKLILLSIPLSIVAAFAFTLNGSYYRYYFIDANYPSQMPLLMAIFFIASELILWSFSSQKNFISILLKYGLVLFSILATLSSQFASTSEKETENEKLIYEKIDNSADIKRYEDQIKIQDERINSIFAERKEKSYYGLTDDEMDFAQTEKSKYEKLLDSLKFENKTEIQEVYTVSNIYNWMAEDLPRIFKSGLNEEFIRVLFQLFSSIILAAIAPVCISLIRSNSIIKPEIEMILEPIPDKIDEIPELTPVIEEIKPEIEIEMIQPTEPWPRPDPIPEPVEVNQLSRIAASNITMMLLRGNKFLLRPETASKRFLKVEDSEVKGLMYSTGECQIMYDFIIEHKLENESKEKIMEVWNNG